MGAAPTQSCSTNPSARFRVLNGTPQISVSSSEPYERCSSSMMPNTASRSDAFVTSVYSSSMTPPTFGSWRPFSSALMYQRASYVMSTRLNSPYVNSPSGSSHRGFSERHEPHGAEIAILAGVLCAACRLSCGPSRGECRTRHVLSCERTRADRR